jgi:hypothetical protein
MKSNGLRWRARARMVLGLAALAALAGGVGAATSAVAAGAFTLPTYFSGLLNDYTPASATAGTPYEMHGKWSLKLTPPDAATFTAEMTMETADFANADPGDPTKLGAHTHHISVTDGVIHNDLTDATNWMTSCPTFKPPVAGGFVVTGTAYVTGNGGNPPFGNPSLVTICILGGAQNPAVAGTQSIVQFANLTLTFASTSHAATHFGSQPINGVVVTCQSPFNTNSNDCNVDVAQ